MYNYCTFRPDCVEILQRCRNSSSDMGGLSAEDVCDALSPPDKHAPCISLKEYLGIYIYFIIAYF